MAAIGAGSESLTGAPRRLCYAAGMHPFVLIALFAGAAAAAEQSPAPPLAFEAGTVLAGGHVLAMDITLPPRPGPVDLLTRDGVLLHWRLTVKDGETRLLQTDGHWAAKAEYSRTQRDGRMICQVYQTYWSPEWAVKGGNAAPRPDYRPADDRIYAFRDIPCP